MSDAAGIHDVALLADRLRATALPDGEFTVASSADAALRQATGAPVSPRPHAAIANVATLAASGASLDALFAMFDASLADGPMLGECRVRFTRPLEFRTYRVARRFVDVVRKRSRRLGTMDVVRFVAALHDEGEEPAAEVEYTWIVPRRGAP